MPKHRRNLFGTRLICHCIVVLYTMLLQNFGLLYIAITMKVNLIREKLNAKTRFSFRSKAGLSFHAIFKGQKL
jgi:hypothetical protein